MDITEKILLLLFSTVSLYMYIEGEAFSSDVAIFPQTFAALTLLLVGLIAARSLYRGLSERSELSLAGQAPSTNVSRDRSEIPHAENADQAMEIHASDAIETEELDRRRLSIISALTFSYILVSYAIGLFWATPLFLIGYGAIFGVSKRDLLVIITLSIAITFTFMELTNIQLMGGVFTR